MKRLQVLLLVSLASVLLFSGCGKKEEEADEPAVAQVIEKQPELENTETPADSEAEPEAPVDDEQPPAEGMVRSTLTNEWIDGDRTCLLQAAIDPFIGQGTSHHTFCRGDRKSVV